MKKIFITGVPDIGNQGSFAMFKVLIDNVNQMLPGEYEYVLDTNNVEAAKQVMSDLNIKKVEVIPDFFSVNSRGKIDLLLKYYLKLLQLSFELVRGKKRSTFLKKLSECDAIINIGGDTLSHSSGQFNTLTQLDKLLLARKLGLHTVILAHTLGEYKNPYRMLILRKMNKIDLITVREKYSFDYMNSLGFKKVIRTSDLAFLLEPTDYLANELKLKEIGKLACFVPSSMLYRKTFSDLRGLDEKYEAYLDIVRYVIDNLLQRGFKVLLIPHVFVKAYRDDLDAEHIKDELYPQNDKVIYYNRQFYAHEIKEIVKYSECVISFRMHPTIGAISQQVPAFLIIDSHKGTGVLGELEPERFIIGCRGLSQDDLRTRIESSLSEFLASLDEIKFGLNQDKIKKVQEAAAKTFVLLDKTIRGG